MIRVKAIYDGMQQGNVGYLGVGMAVSVARGQGFWFCGGQVVKVRSGSSRVRWHCFYGYGGNDGGRKG